MLGAKSISKSYGRQPALEEIYLTVSPGELLTLLGPSGCGKTTLLRVIAGFERPDRGEVHIDGIKVSSPRRVAPPHTRKLSMIFQDLALWPHMTVRENIEFVLQRNTRERQFIEEKIGSLLEQTNLRGYEQRYPHELSGGERQRLAIARAFAATPKYVLMDEPFSDLDHLVKEELKIVLNHLKESFQIGILYVTHNVDEALSMADRIAVMNKGVILQQGTVAEVMNNPGTPFVRRFLQVTS
jgi:ABC-type Fe3+/spermidine/putrescine transport system ATPase subunit